MATTVGAFMAAATSFVAASRHWASAGQEGEGGVGQGNKWGVEEDGCHCRKVQCPSFRGECEVRGGGKGWGEYGIHLCQEAPNRDRIVH